MNKKKRGTHTHTFRPPSRTNIGRTTNEQKKKENIYKNWISFICLLILLLLYAREWMCRRVTVYIHSHIWGKYMMMRDLGASGSNQKEKSVHVTCDWTIYNLVDVAFRMWNTRVDFERGSSIPLRMSEKRNGQRFCRRIETNDFPVHSQKHLFICSKSIHINQ